MRRGPIDLVILGLEGLSRELPQMFKGAAPCPEDGSKCKPWRIVVEANAEDLREFVAAFAVPSPALLTFVEFAVSHHEAEIWVGIEAANDVGNIFRGV